jgi:hypothetical protein
MNSSNNAGGRARGYSNPQTNWNAPRANASGRPLLHGGGSRESMRMPSSIRIRRLPSNTNTAERPLSSASDTESRDFADPGMAGRRRSSSAPQRPTIQELNQEDDLARQHTDQPFMPSIVEGQATTAQQARGINPVPSRPGDAPQPLSRTNTAGSGGSQAMINGGNTVRSNRGLRRLRSGALPPRQQQLSADAEYDADVVSLLDLIGMCFSRTSSSAFIMHNADTF